MTNLHESYRMGEPRQSSLPSNCTFLYLKNYVSILYPYPTTCSFPVTQWGFFPSLLPLLQILHLASAQNLSPFCILLVTAQHSVQISNLRVLFELSLYEELFLLKHRVSFRRVLSISWPKKRPIFIDARICEGNSGRGCNAFPLIL